ncbi:MAG TPA: nicotinamide-nucleotide amidohydrolase family protein [Candidatus Dormibacteraeota bacterium]|jgi:nicotinamide-nucleotide amidase
MAIGPLQKLLRERDLTICAAESCTGGLVCAALTELPGSSEYFLGGVVTYANEAKVRHLGVEGEVLERVGAVSREVAEQMAAGARRLFGADVALSVTGIAGPHADGEKPVGLTYIGFASEGTVEVREYHWTGGRASNRVASVAAALALATEILSRQHHRHV